MKSIDSFSEAISWFGELSQLAGTVRRDYCRADRQASKAAKEVKKAIGLALLASKGAYNLVGDTEDLIPPTREDQLTFWVNWITDCLDEVYRRSKEASAPSAEDDGDDKS